MKEIEFRGINNETGQFVYGWYTKLQEGARIFDAIIAKVDDEFTRFYIHDAKTISQFTGLRDKNGVKIFCGDIIEDDGIDYESGNFARGEIVFIDGEFSIQYMHLDRNLYERIISAKRESVVGNVHQHPHLLEQKK